MTTGLIDIDCPHSPHICTATKWREEGSGMTIQRIKASNSFSATDCPLWSGTRSPIPRTGTMSRSLRGNEYMHWSVIYCLMPNLVNIVCDPNPPNDSITGLITRSRLRSSALSMARSTLWSTRESRIRTAKWVIILSFYSLFVEISFN